MRTEAGDADDARRVAPGRSGWRAASRSIPQVWRIEDRRNDLFSAVTTFVLGWVLLEVGLVGLVRAPFVVEPAEPWWRVALLGVGCLLILVKRAHPVLALLGGVAVTAVDIRWGGSLAITLVLWDLLYAAALWSGPRARAWLWGVAVTVAVLGSVAAGEAARDVRQFVYMGLQLGAVLLVPMWWATNVRTKSELAELAGERADLAAREAEAAARTADLERQRASDLERIAELDRHEAVQAERAAMARDLHDVIASHLSTIAIHSGAALALPPDAAKDRAALEQVRSSAVASLDEMRSMILLLRTEGRRDDVPDAVAAPGRLAGLDALLDAARATTTVTLDDPDRVVESALPAAADQALFRIAQEAVTNALKHAPGSPVAVRVVRDGSAVVLEVRDDGAPGSAAPVEAPLSAGTGLLTMRERADGLGGTFDAGPTTAGGWVVRAAVPVAGGPSEKESA
ncbi:sensor histidine kinase [Cellulosimicrobium cellulans]|uniref:sensor histidine kinase n=1 Tax=Cellulosimicrobium cellulans TaxID=1710 RepID=UPI002096943A|nr:histidine kinase [Cellulosimicrobium cellulans]MCO7273802.1 histidine kinase [Cellulosimicrobium cellulans]